MPARTPLALLLLPLLGSCVEYAVVDPDPVLPGAYNPRELDGDMVEDVLDQISSQKADILWVLDSSRSMAEENAALAELFPLFIQHFQDLEADYHIGVVTTDMGGFSGPGDLSGKHGRLVKAQGFRWIDPDTPDPIGVFTEMTDVYDALSQTAGFEKGREAAWTALALRGQRDNRGFLRQDGDAWLHITVVSDEDDASTRDPIGKADFVDWINTIRPVRSKTTFNSIVTLDPQNEFETRGDKYMDLTEQIGGEVFDLHANDWSTILDTLGGLQAPAPITEWHLAELPVVDTLEVYVQQGDVVFAFEEGLDWEYDPVRNSVRFLAFQVPEGASVILRYLPAQVDFGLTAED